MILHYSISTLFYTYCYIITPDHILINIYFSVRSATIKICLTVSGITVTMTPLTTNRFLQKGPSGRLRPVSDSNTKQSE